MPDYITRDLGTKKILESFGFYFEEVRTKNEKQYKCKKLKHSYVFGTNRRHFRYYDFEIILTNINDKNSAWKYEVFNLGQLIKSENSNSYLFCIRKAFEKMMNLLENKKLSDKNKLKFISKR